MPSTRTPDLPGTTCPCSTAIFVGLRALDPILQWGILTHDIGAHLVQRLQGSRSSIPAAARAAPAAAADLPLCRGVLLAMATGASLNHVFWATSVRNEALTPARAAGLGVGNALFSSANTLLFATGATTTAAGRDCARATLGVGAALYVLGMAVETCAEVQRKSFKAVKGNEARLCTRGLWGVVRHANYAGDALWRAGFAVAAGGWTWGAVTGLCTLGYFAWRATPALEERCEAKYGEQWKKYVKDTPSKLIPGIM